MINSKINPVPLKQVQEIQENLYKEIIFYGKN